MWYVCQYFGKIKYQYINVVFGAIYKIRIIGISIIYKDDENFK